jgi:hypothetical protein
MKMGCISVIRKAFMPEDLSPTLSKNGFDAVMLFKPTNWKLKPFLFNSKNKEI